MQRKRLGQTDLQIPPLVFGGNVFGWGADATTSCSLLDMLMERGFNCVDTADCYSYWAPGNQGGESETIIGDWLKARGGRDRVLILTKCGFPDAPGGANLTAGHIVTAAEASLRRLRTDYIDLYQAHFDDKATPLDETLRAFEQLMVEGKARAIGASNYAADRLAQALATSEQFGLPRYECLQPRFNLYDRDGFEGPLASLCRREGLGVLTYYSLASGFLSGKYRSDADLGKSHARGQDIRPYLTPRGLRILHALDGVAERYRATPAQIALAWLMSHPVVTAPIASATSPDQLRELLAAADITLDEDALWQLNVASRSDPAPV